MTTPFRDLVAHDALARLERFKECAGLFLKVSCEALEAELSSKGHAPTTHQRERMAAALSAALMSFVFVPETAPSKGALRDHAAAVAVKIIGEIFHG